VLSTGVRLDDLAWNNGGGLRSVSVGLGAEVMVKRDGRGHWYFHVRGEILGPWEDRLERRQLPSTSPLIKNESRRSKED
jgi:hypothetical protein